MSTVCCGADHSLQGETRNMSQGDEVGKMWGSCGSQAAKTLMLWTLPSIGVSGARAL